MSLAPAEAPASRPVTRRLTPLTVVPSCLGPLEKVASGTPRSHSPVVAVSVPFGLRVQPRLVSKLSKKIVVGGLPPPLQARIALSTFNRPPVTVLPDKELTGSTLLRRFAFRLAVLSAHLEGASAAAPETCGVAIEVPLKKAKPPIADGREDTDTRRSQIHSRGAETGEGGLRIPVVSRGDRHHVRGIIVGWVVRGDVVVAIAVAGGRDK